MIHKNRVTEILYGLNDEGEWALELLGVPGGVEPRYNEHDQPIYYNFKHVSLKELAAVYAKKKGIGYEKALEEVSADCIYCLEFTFSKYGKYLNEMAELESFSAAECLLENIEEQAKTESF